MKKFKIGDRVERIESSNSDGSGNIFEVGDTGIIKKMDDEYADVKLDKNNYLFKSNDLNCIKLARINSLKQFLESNPK